MHVYLIWLRQVQSLIVGLLLQKLNTVSGVLMANKSKIEWTDTTWNTVTGCTKISPGCKHCYAETMTKRLRAMGSKKYLRGFYEVVVHPETLEEPLRWTKPRMVFVNSMSDLFHRDVPFSYIQSVFEVMNKASHHTFQVLTKRIERVFWMENDLNWTDNIWLGTSIESQRYTKRVETLRTCLKSRVRFLSIEPLLGPIKKLNLRFIDWVIVGGESGKHARPMKVDWVRDLREQCNISATHFFFKQWGGVNKKLTGRTLDGRTWDEMPLT